MNNEHSDENLLGLGRELSQHLLRHSDPRDEEALYQARRRAFAAGALPHRNVKRNGAWLAAVAATGLAAFTIVMVSHLWDGTSERNIPGEHDAFLAKSFTEDEAPWRENLDMLQNMDFSLWLDMADPEDAG
jgi:hypothetical protein